ncbi:MAG: hypothetical protein AAFQ64_21395 [Pseudomonadota bacterium]
MIGSADDDFPKGGSGSDTFVFETGFDLDRIVDFSFTADFLAFGPILGSGLDEQMTENMAETIGLDLIIDSGGRGRIALAGVTSIDQISGVVVFL